MMWVIFAHQTQKIPHSYIISQERQLSSHNIFAILFYDGSVRQAHCINYERWCCKTIFFYFRMYESDELSGWGWCNFGNFGISLAHAFKSAVCWMETTVS